MLMPRDLAAPTAIGSDASGAVERASDSSRVRRRVGVCPARVLETHGKLLAALAEAFPVRFEGRSPDELGGLDGALLVGIEEPERLPAGLTVLVTPASGETQMRTTIPVHARLSNAKHVCFSSHERLPPALRGQTLVECQAERVAGGASKAASVLAAIGDEAVWWERRSGSGGTSVHGSAFCPSELLPRETLRDQLRPGRFISLLPVLVLLQRVCGELAWRDPPLRASFVIDDPNLHRCRYGFLDYRELVRHAAEHGYHTGIAMVPLDGWRADRRAAALFRENRSSLSLLMHGNNHTARELGRLTGEREATMTLAQACMRTERFERRSGVSVGRVMAPPHGTCAEASVRAMFRLGYDAATASRPLPWRDGVSPVPALTGWYPAEMVGGGIPVLPRHPLCAPRQDLVFRALLGQPLILYGHHWDFANGLDVLAEAARDINRLGDVRWGPLDALATHSYRTRRSGDVLEVQLHSRRANVEVPRGVRALRVSVSHLHGKSEWEDVHTGTRRGALVSEGGGWISAPVEVHSGEIVEVRLVPARPLRSAEHEEPRVRPYVLTRRVLVEGRDRLLPQLLRLDHAVRAFRGAVGP